MVPGGLVPQQLSIALSADMKTLILCFVFSFSTQLESPPKSNPGYCDKPHMIHTSSVCTSCAASPTASCPTGFAKITRDAGIADCSYSVEIGGRVLQLPGCHHTCEKVLMERRCCSGFWGSSCLSCPTWQGRTCNGQGHCLDGLTGNGSCVCDEGFTGFACQKCDNKNATREHCDEGSLHTCDQNTEHSSPDGQHLWCMCKAGYQGDGEVCIPVNPCSQDNGGCPSDSMTCVYVLPGQSRCVCRSGTEGPDSSGACTPASPCTESTCETSARCETGPDGLVRCACDPHKLPDGRHCYGNILEQIVVLDGKGQLRGKLSSSITLFETRCQLTVSKHGPFTAFVPLLTSPQPRILEEFLCEQYLILGQRRLKELRGNDLWMLGGEAIRFRDNKFFFVRDPDTLYSIIEGDIPAANGIIHIIDAPVTNIPADSWVHQLPQNETIGELISRDTKFGRFLSLVENCEVSLPLWNPGLLTVFVPTNDAIEHLQDAAVSYMITQAQHKLQELLRHHILSSTAVTLEQLSSMAYLHTMASQVIRINISADGRLLLGEEGFWLRVANIVASNGIIHLIDGVLIPPTIEPILPNRCDVTESRIIVGLCVGCDHLPQTQCPLGSTELGPHVRDCKYQASPSSSILSRNGCAKLCNMTQTRPECCKGFYGPDCKPCPGGFQKPCYGKGTCLDSITGNGTCSCAPGFKGVACHLCAEQSKHGERCDEECKCVHGVCDNRPGSRGVCRGGSCQEGFSGELCDKMMKPCNSDGAFELCHIHAYCVYWGLHTTCACLPGYEGDGHSCTPINPCVQTGHGGCDINAWCLYVAPAKASCICNDGWTGDGLVCMEINNCLLESRGGCHRDAECLTIGPGQSECTCKKGYMGDGKVCDAINPCLLDGGGCHPLASCEVRHDRLHVCLCPDGYAGDGTTCYSSVLAELSGNSDFNHFYRLIKMSSSLNFGGNITALVPSKDAFSSFPAPEKAFWMDPRRLPSFLRVHFLDGALALEDLKNKVDQQLPTLHSQIQWGIKNRSAEVMVGSAAILIPDVPATNGYIHIIDMVLRPPLSIVPPVFPSLMELLNHTPTFSLFRQTALLYNLTNSIKFRKYTILVPSDDAIKGFTKQKNVTVLDEDIFKYHVILNELLYPGKLGDIAVKNTFLGSEYQLMFHTNNENQMLVNEVLLDGDVKETRDGVLIGISQVLNIHKNRCNKDVVLKVHGRCGPCNMKPRCHYNSKPVTPAFPASMVPNCRYRQTSGGNRWSLPGCVGDCTVITKDHSCCPGYFGHNCFKCPGQPGEWCSGNGHCQDGVFGSGECLCMEGFHGIACENCEPGRYGKECKSVCTCVHGKCVDGINGTGQCLCYVGWKGLNCSEETSANACDGLCDVNANCITAGPRSSPTCICGAGYQGNGTFCQEVNLCEDSNGGCAEHADCTVVAPGERSCTCRAGYMGDGVVCLEINGCLEDNGGCHEEAECFKIGLNQIGCACMAGYSGNGYHCDPINPCKTDNGGCSLNAYCNHTGPGERTCVCLKNFMGDGLTCRGSTAYEVSRHPDASWLHQRLEESKMSDLKGKGPFTVFVPHREYIKNFKVEPWVNTSHLGDLLRYHMVGCKQLLESHLWSLSEAVTLSGYQLRFTFQEGNLYINEESKIISTNYVTSTGVIHFIDRVLVPYDLLNNSTEFPATMNITAAAEAYGYTIFSKILKEAGLMALIANPLHHPFTMLWPTDAAFLSLPQERKRRLYSKEHREELSAYIRAHIIRGITLVAAALPGEGSFRTMFGSTLFFSCHSKSVGDLLVDGGDARVLQRHMLSEVGIAYGIDSLLEPPNLGARCDRFEETEFDGPYSSCNKVIKCPAGSRFTGKILRGLRSRPDSWSPRRQRNSITKRFPRRLRRLVLCRRRCSSAHWVPDCCRNHHGRDCQVCPGGLRAPCGNRGLCDDTMLGNGRCRCQSGFTGVACELCELRHYGPNCTACLCSLNGQCQDGLEGDGRCFCAEGWSGKQCDVQLGAMPVCSPLCDPNAACRPDNRCECKWPYEGDGRRCTAPDLCSEDNGGCHPHANCIQAGIHITCFCPLGYTGDGYSCSPINRCVQEENGGCGDFASCVFTGPNERECRCHPGYMGNGILCQKKVTLNINRCLKENGGCDPKAECQDLHFQESTAGVFHLSSPAGRYLLNYTEAQARCQQENATLATLAQVSSAQQLGMHVCMAGWMEGQLIGHPVTFPSVSCGNNQVGVVTYRSPVNGSSTFDAYCYRVKEVSCICGHGYIGNGLFCNGDLASVVATSEDLSTFYLILLNYANSTTEGESLMTLLSSRSTFLTLFIPQNAGFYANETLSWRDVEYHICADSVVHLYEDLEQDMAIASRLGYNLTVDILSTNTTLDTGSHIPNKRVNHRRLVVWDIPAVNGIIHVIEAPLKAPPVAPAVTPGQSLVEPQSSVAGITAVLGAALVIIIIAIVSVCLLKRRSTGSQFHYFQNEDNGAFSSTEVNPALVSIPNPLYSGNRALIEPFGDSHETDPSQSLYF